MLAEDQVADGALAREDGLAGDADKASMLRLLDLGAPREVVANPSDELGANGVRDDLGAASWAEVAKLLRPTVV